ncbi:MAG: hypothetical protein J0G99_15350 [Alphaproteobacteria bacterium]|nr:hypothetical protein [Alphaproteobacteria bacterium]
MGDDFRTLTAEEFERWLTPLEAAAALAPVGPKVAAAQLLEAARAEMVRTAAEMIYCEPKNSPSFAAEQRAEVPSYFWAHVAGNSNFWDTGIVRMWFGNTPYFRVPTAFRCLNVRFNPEDVAKLKPRTPRQVLADEKAVPAPIQRDSGVKAPPLPKAALDAWYVAYKLAYSDRERTLDHAWDHAKAAFPEKTVTRDAVRKLMAGGKPGPRPK